MLLLRLQFRKSPYRFELHCGGTSINQFARHLDGYTSRLLARVFRRVSPDLNQSRRDATILSPRIATPYRFHVSSWMRGTGDGDRWTAEGGGEKRKGNNECADPEIKKCPPFAFSAAKLCCAPPCPRADALLVGYPTPVVP